MVELQSFIVDIDHRLPDTAHGYKSILGTYPSKYDIDRLIQIDNMEKGSLPYNNKEEGPDIIAYVKVKHLDGPKRKRCWMRYSSIFLLVVVGLLVISRVVEDLIRTDSYKEASSLQGAASSRKSPSKLFLMRVSVIQIHLCRLMPSSGLR